jgi:hypothetical protein
MDNPAKLATLGAHAKYTIHKTNKCQQRETHQSRVCAKMLAKGEQFLSLIIRPPYYSYSQDVKNNIDFAFCFDFYFLFFSF